MSQRPNQDEQQAVVPEAQAEGTRIPDEADGGQRVGESAAPQATGEWGSVLDEDLPPVVPDAAVEVPKTR